jgi:hypothetical protein
MTDNKLVLDCYIIAAAVLSIAVVGSTLNGVRRAALATSTISC